MSTFITIYCVIGCILGLFMYGISMAGGNATSRQRIAGLFIYPAFGQLYGIWIIYMILGSIFS